MSTKKNISDELLGSFIDGNTTPEQSAEAWEYISASPDNFEEFRIASMAANCIKSNAEFVMNTDLGIMGTAAFIGGGGAAEKIFENLFQHCPHIAAFSNEDVTDIEPFNIESNTTSIKSEMIYRAPSVVGPNMKLGFIEQNNDMQDVIKCQQHILHQYGIERDERELLDIIKKNWDSDSLYNVGGVLEKYDIPVTRYDNANVITAVKELAEGHSVVMVVNSRDLWAGGLWEGHFENIEDMLLNKPDHSFITAGINTMNPKDIRIEISEVGQNDIKLDYSFNEFMDLWRNNKFFMLSTEQAIPNYNPEMVNFDYSYLGSISNVGGLPYPEFEILYDLSMNDAADVNFVNKIVDAYCLAVDSDVCFPEAIKELSALSLEESDNAYNAIGTYIDDYQLNEILSEGVNSYYDYYCAMEGYFEQLENSTGADFSDNIGWYNEQQSLI